MTEDLGIKMAGKAEKRWTEIKERAEKEIENSKIEIQINEAIIALAEIRITEDKKDLNTFEDNTI